MQRGLLLLGLVRQSLENNKCLIKYDAQRVECGHTIFAG